jgi:O-antigen biosynthesis protein
VIWTPFATLVHHETATRPREVTPPEQARLQRELDKLKARWGSALLEDPTYNPNLTLEWEDGGLAFPPRITPPWRR